jgi:hypothetical protein
MSAQVAITQLPTAGAITGTEAVPIVQNGVTVQTTTAALAGTPVQTYTYLTVTQTPQLTNSRYVGASNGLTISDGGAQGLFNITTTGALLSLVSSGTGFQVKTSGTAITGRSIAVTGVGLGITNGDGIAGDPTIALAGQVLSLANLNANGLMTITSAGVLNAVSITGTANQVGVANGNGISGAPTISIVDNATLPGTGGVVIPKGTTLQQPVGVSGQFRFNTTTNRFEGYISGSWVNLGAGDGTVTNVNGTTNQISVLNGTTTPIISITPNPIIPGTASITMPIGNTAARPTGVNGMFRYNTDVALFEGYINGAWQIIAAGTGVTSIITGTGLQGGPITSTGTISISDTGVTAGSYGSSSQVPTYAVNAQGQLTAAANVAISATAIGAVTSVTGTANEITSTGGQTPVLSLPSSMVLTGKTIAGGSYNMTAASVASDVVTTNTATQTLTNKTISGASNTLTNIANASLTNSSLTIGSTSIALGATASTLGGLTSVAVTQDPTTNLQLATKQYVDSVAAVGLTFHQPVYCATSVNITEATLSYNNGASGVGATLTRISSFAVLSVDGVNPPVGARVMVRLQTTGAWNGIYTVTSVGSVSTGWVLTRATDADTYGSGVNQLSLNDYFFVQNGTTNKGIAYVLSAPVGTIIFGTSSIEFAEFSSSQVYTGTTPIDVTGTVISLTTVPATLGGTGQSSYAVGNLLYASGTTALSKLPIGTSSQVLKSNGTTPFWDLNPTYLPVVLHDASTVQISVASGYLPVLLNNGVTIVNVALF